MKNRFIKTLLARYVIYVEVIGYVFVILFIAGLVALSFIKAEDEYLNLKGQLEVPAFTIQFDHRHHLVDLISEADSLVGENSPLIEVTDDGHFIADQLILKNLQLQEAEARDASNGDLARRIASLIQSIESKQYNDLEIMTVRTPVAGRFFLFEGNGDIFPENKTIGGVYDFENSLIRVSALPQEKRDRKKLKPRQTGTVNIAVGSGASIPVKIVLNSVSDGEALFTISPIDKAEQRSIAAQLKDQRSMEVDIHLLVGWKSWMRLIWR